MRGAEPRPCPIRDLHGQVGGELEVGGYKAGEFLLLLSLSFVATVMLVLCLYGDPASSAIDRRATQR